MIVITDSECAGYAFAGHPERPERISDTIRYLQKQIEIPIQWESPLIAGDEILSLAHTETHLKLLRVGADFDPDTPWRADMLDHARRSVGAALKALGLIGQGKTSFSLMRPPGHHACRDKAMGFCYLNQAAIAVLHALEKGYEKVAVFDFDVHHGNGTEDILAGCEGASFYSVHQHPCYPGTGVKSFGNIHNYPVSPAFSGEQYREVLRESLEDLSEGKPDLVVVSAGFDAYIHDPLSNENLLEDDFHWLGKQVSSLDVPSLSILEGGYSRELPALILAYLCGLEG